MAKPTAMLPAAPKELHPSSLTDQTCQRFSLYQIQLATKNFDEALVIGCGGFGKVYKGYINGSATAVAIKRLNSMSNQGTTEFHAEVEMLSKLRHCNLVSLIGYCKDGKEMVLVYDYMPHGTLGDRLHRAGTPLSWLQRLKMCIGAARGLDYLHTGTGTQHGIIHRDVKTSNILLDENFAAKISDFGLAKIGPTNQTRTYVSTGVKGTFGYMDPCYFYTGKLTRKSDVYSFGVVLLEVICGRPAVDTSLDETECGLAPWAQDRIKQGKLNHIIDSILRGQISSRCLKDFASIASSCLHNQPNQRPTMSDIVSRLEVISSLQQRLDSSATKGKFMSRVIFFLSSKAESKTSNFIPAPISGSNGERSNRADDRSEDTSYALPARPRRPRNQTENNLKPFSYNVLETATRHFRPDSMVGEGSHGLVFKGWINKLSLAAAKPGTGTAIAVKRIKRSFDEKYQDQAERLAGVKYLGRLNHPNLVKLIGYCLEDDQRLLVYEYMPRGTLDDHLFRRRSFIQPLSWNQRLQVVLGAAKGLAYLHRQGPKLLFCDMRAHSILMDSNYNAKLSNFCLADVDQIFKTVTSPPCTNGYDAPECIGFLTARSHIFTFGVILLEVMTGRRVIDNTRPYHERKLYDFAKPYLSTGWILQIIDPHIHGQYSPTVAKRAAKIAKKCLSMNPFERPTADEVVKELEELKDLQKAEESSRRKSNLKPLI